MNRGSLIHMDTVVQGLLDEDRNNHQGIQDKLLHVQDKNSMELNHMQDSHCDGGLDLYSCNFQELGQEQGTEALADSKEYHS